MSDKGDCACGKAALYYSPGDHRPLCGQCLTEENNDKQRSGEERWNKKHGPTPVAETGTVAATGSTSA